MTSCIGDSLKARLETFEKRAEAGATTAGRDTDDEPASLSWGSLDLKHQSMGKPPIYAPISFSQRSTETKPGVPNEDEQSEGQQHAHDGHQGQSEETADSHLSRLDALVAIATSEENVVAMH